MASILNPLDVEDLRVRVSSALDVFLASRQPALHSVSVDLIPVQAAVVDFLERGKRLRPAFCWWGWRAAGGHDAVEPMRAAASLELLQACALIHDDLMDGSLTRRGVPAVHRRFAQLHTEKAWSGDATDFGTASAILIGDLCLAWADEMLFDSGVGADSLLRAKPIYDVMRTELISGQFLDVVEQARGDASAQTALNVARYKSAKYTIERPLHLGATLAGAAPELLRVFSNYGLPLGEAFQVRDDVLGVFGDPIVTGKPAGDDLREGKRTYLIAVAFANANASQTATMEACLGSPTISENQVHEVRGVITETGALAAAEDLIARRTAEATQALDDGELPPTARQVLTDLAFAATRRSA